MASLLLLTASVEGYTEALPALGLLAHRVRVARVEPSALVDAGDVDAVVVDGRLDLVTARMTCRLVHATGLEIPVLLIVTEGGLSAVTVEWGIDDVILVSAGPAEIEARLRLLSERVRQTPFDDAPDQIEAGDVTIDASAYSVRLKGRPLDLTYKEFELLKYLVQYPGRVFTRAQLLQEVWGYDYYGGTRTVDVHVRRLRAKLGAENESLIGTVRNVGYRFEPPADRRRAASLTTGAASESGADAAS